MKKVLVLLTVVSMGSTLISCADDASGDNLNSVKKLNTKGDYTGGETQQNPPK